MTKQRRALTMPTRRAPIALAGDPGVAAALARALDVSDEGRELTHGFHTYPARMHPQTARRGVALLAPARGGALLDPFCGSGTVLVEALRVGARAVGVDANPLAVRIAWAKTWIATAKRRAALVDAARAVSAAALAEGKAARRSGYRAPRRRALSPDDEARVRGWFDPHVRRELESLVSAIARVDDAELRDLLIAIVSSVIVKMSRRASDTAAEREPRRLGRGMAARLFAGRAEELALGLDALARAVPQGTPRVDVRVGDARALPIADGSVDAILTSPPYAGTYDYLEHHALRLAFLGIDAEEFASREIGARRRFRERAADALSEWERDLSRAFSEMRRVLAPSGRALLLIGDSLAGSPPRAIAIHADDLVARLAQRAGLVTIATASATRAALGSAERAAFARRPKREHLILLAPA